MTLYLGKQNPTYDSRDLSYARVRESLDLPAVPPPGGGYGNDFPDWLMLGNGPDDTVSPGFQGCGDCAWAGPAHETMEAHCNAKSAIPSFSGKTIVNQYAEYSGYNVQTGADDNGSNVRDVLKWRQTKGLLDDSGSTHKIGAYVALEPGDLDQLWGALWLFEVVGVGIQFPQSAMDQFNANQMWTVVPGTKTEGGHYIPVVGHPTPGIWTCVTWGSRQTMSAQFLTTYCDEAWAWIDAERYSAITGKTLQGFDDTNLEQYLTDVAQAKSGAAQ
jgi:hypothetical protein